MLEEDVHVEQPLRYVKRKEEDKVYKFRKALYGLKQALRVWYICIDSYFIAHDFHRCPYGHALYIKSSAYGDILIVWLYVDDLIFMGNNLKLVQEFKEAMIA